MGYYDDHSQGRFKGDQGGKKSGYIGAGLVGAILGALLILIALPSLTHRDVIPNNPSSNNANLNTSTKNEVIQKQIAVDVSTNTTKAVQKNK